MSYLKRSETNDINNLLLRIIFKIMQIDQGLLNYGIDTPIHNAELRMLLAISENEGIHITGLADSFGITKGAVSQNVARLYKKGIITKKPDPSNHSRLLLFVSEKGKKALINHEKYHQLYHESINGAINSLDKDAEEKIIDFLSSLEINFDDLLEKYSKLKLEK